MRSAAQQEPKVVHECRKDIFAMHMWLLADCGSGCELQVRDEQDQALNDTSSCTTSKISR